MKTLYLSITSFLKILWGLLTEPFESLPRAEDRRYAIISTAFLLLFFIFVEIEQVVAGNTPRITSLILLASYFVARTHWYKIATMALLVTLSFPSYLVALNTPNPDPNLLLAIFSWIVLPLILSGLLYSVRITVIYSAANILMLASMPLFREGMEFGAMGAALGFYILASLFIIIVMIQRDAFEKDRQTELIESRNQLSEEALQRERFAEQAHRRADQLAMLNEVSRVISSLHGLEETLDAILEQIRRVIPLDVFFVALYDESTDMVTFPILFDGGGKWQEKPVSLQKANRIARVIRSGQPLLINRTEEEIEESKKSDTRFGDLTRVAASALVSPLQVGTRIMGVISTQSYSMDAYNDEHSMLLTAIAQQVVIAIENARLLEQTEKRAQRLAILNEIGQELSTLTNLPTLMEKVYQQIQKALSADLFFVNLLDAQNERVTFPFMMDTGQRWEQKPKPLTDMEGSFTYETIRTRQPLLINQWSASPENDESNPPIIGDDTKITKSLMFAPLLSGQEMLGAISAQSYKANAYTEEDLNLLSGIANQVAVSIKNTRLLEETKQNEGYLSTLNELGRVVSELRNLPELLEVIYQEVKKHLSVDAFYVGLHHPESNTVSYPIMYDEGISYHPEPDDITTHSFLYKLLHGEHAKFIRRTEEEMAREDKNYGMLGNVSKVSASLLIAPLKTGEQVIGVISAQSYKVDAYTEDDLNLLIGIGNQVGVAIQNARLLEEIRQNAEHLSILNEAGRAVSQIMDLPDLLEVIYDQGRKSFSLDAFFVGLYHPERNEISFPLVFDDGRRFDAPPSEVIESSFLGRFLKGEKSILINRTEEELARNVTQQQRMGDKSKLSASIIAAPLISRDQIVGMISAQSYTLNAYNKSHVRLLEGIANQIAIAIENSRLYTSAQQEIRERERVEMELQKERDFAVQVMNTLGQGVSVSMLDGVYEYVNPAYAHMLGYTPDDMIGEPSEHFALPEEDGKHSEQRTHREHGKTTTYETRLRHKDGHIVHVLVTGVPRYQNGRVIGSIAAITDLTERRRTEIERENLLAEMERKNAELERFTYTVSHDLKSPLVTIGGFLGFLEADIKSRDFKRVERTLSRIHEATKKMQRLLEELLELSRIGRIANPSLDVSFGDLVHETLELVEGQLRAKQVEVEVDAKFPIVHVDRVRISEVIQNLITNAIKFMGNQQNPKIHIGVETRDGESIYFVKDNGVGIAPEFHDRVFGLFNKLNPNTDGTGIGLALVKRIIEVHGGRIWVESEPDKGATFFFTLENKPN